MATAKTKSKSKTEPKPKPEPKKSSLDLSWLGDKGAKQAGHFLERVCGKRGCDPERVLVACLAYCATLSNKRHGIHLLVQDIERVTRCKI